MTYRGIVQNGVVVIDGQKPAEGTVVEVTPDGPAARAGIEPGDVILEADRTPVASVAELESRIAAGGESILLLVRRAGSTVFIAVTR